MFPKHFQQRRGLTHRRFLLRLPSSFLRLRRAAARGLQQRQRLGFALADGRADQPQREQGGRDRMGVWVVVFVYIMIYIYIMYIYNIIYII